MKKYYLYRISNTVNEKVYIVVTFRPLERWREHKSSNSPCKKLVRAMDKHGRENFSFNVLCIGSEEYILGLEPSMILAENSVKGGYNIQEGGASGYGFISETRSTDTPIYVSGFWMPSDRFAQKMFDIKKRTYVWRKKKGLIGETCISMAPKSPRIQAFPVYVRGFWFPTNKHAQNIFNVSQTAISRWYRQEQTI